MNKILFSIITVCLNNKKGLVSTHESVRNQINKNFEWIVIDGGSNDGTLEYIKELNLPYLQWKSEPDKGLYDAMNKGIDSAKGDYLIFLNSGDEFATKEVLNSLSKIVNDNPGSDLIYGDSMEKTSANELVYKKARSHKLSWYGMFTHHQAMLYRRECVGSQRYDLSYKIAADYAFTCSLLAKASKVKYVPFPICMFEGGGLTSTTAIHIQGLKEQWRVGKDILKRSFLMRLSTLFLHLGKHALRRILPFIYNKLRYKKLA